MKHTEYTTNKFAGFGVDTIFVLFFLALEIGRSVQLLSVDGMLMSTTLMMVLVLPYFLPSRVERPSMTNWLAARGTIAIAALMLGLIYGRGVAAAPAGYRTIPMTFLILSSMVSAYVQFYGLMRLRPAKEAKGPVGDNKERTRSVTGTPRVFFSVCSFRLRPLQRVPKPTRATPEPAEPAPDIAPA